MKKYPVLLLLSIISYTLSGQSDKINYQLSLSLGTNFIQPNEALIDDHILNGQNSIGSAYPGFRVQPAIEVRYSLGEHLYLKGGLGIAYFAFEINDIVSGYYYYEAINGVLAIAHPIEEETTQLNIRYLDGTLPLTVGWNLSQKKWLSLEAGVIGQLRLMNKSKASIDDVTYGGFVSETLPDGTTDFYLEILDSPISISSQADADLKTDPFQWGILTSLSSRIFYRQDIPFYVNASYIHYPNIRDFWDGHALRGSILLGLSMRL